MSDLRPVRTVEGVQRSGAVFVELAALHPNLPVATNSVSLHSTSISVHLHGRHSLEHLAQWAMVLGNCARSSGSYPKDGLGGGFFTETRTGVFADTKIEVIAFYHASAGAAPHDPYGMTDPGGTARQIPLNLRSLSNPRARRRMVALSALTLTATATVAVMWARQRLTN